MLLDPDDSSEGISQHELEQFWGKTLSGLTIAQRRVVIELYKKSKRQLVLKQDEKAQLQNVEC